MSQLVGTHRADAVIVGSSLTGLLLGSALAASSMKTAIIDPSDVPDSSVSVTATVLCTDRYEKIAAVHGVDAAHQYAAALQARLHTLLSSPPPYVQEIPVYTYACSDVEGRLLEQQRALLNHLGISASTAPDAGGCPFPVELSLATPSQAAVNLTQWQSALKSSIRRQGGCFYTDRLITFIGNERVCTVRGSVEAQHVILTTGIPPGLRSKRLLALLESRLQVHCRLTSPFPLHSGQQSVLADGLRLTPSASGIFASWDAGRLGTRTQARHHAAMLQRLPRRMPDYPANDLQYRQIVYPMDGLPFIGRLPDASVLWGAGDSVLDAMLAADMLARRVQGRFQREDTLYAPERTIPDSFLRRQLWRSAAVYARNTLRTWAPSCSHCRCRLRYSTACQQWECPFCGSCYTMLGQVCRGPCMRDACISVRQRPDL